MIRIVSILIFDIIFLAEGFLHPHLKASLSTNQDEDASQPLLLTPYVESGHIEEGRRLSRVNLTDIGLDSYAGFFTVDKTYNSNHFFWFFNDTRSSNTIVVWLQGGPGDSSLFGLFDESGPIAVENGAFEEQEFSNFRGRSVIYIDSPVGTGFSFTNDTRGYVTNTTHIGEQLYTTLVQFFTLFPNLIDYNLIISGEQYAAKFATALAYTIHKQNPSAKVKLNLKGLLIGNGWCDPVTQMRYDAHYYQLGIIDWNQKSKIQRIQEAVVDYIQQNKWDQALKEWQDLRFQLDNVGFIYVYDYFKVMHNATKQEPCDYCKLITSTTVRKAIHVGDLPFHYHNDTVGDYFAHDILHSVSPWIKELLEHYAFYFYDGQLDLNIDHVSTVNFLRKLNFSGSAEFEKADTYQIYHRPDEFSEYTLLGYRKSGGNLTSYMPRNAGQWVPKYQDTYMDQIFYIWFMSIGV